METFYSVFFKFKIEISSLDKYTAILMQGSGTFGVESVIQTVSNSKSKFLILENGSYGQRIAKICNLLKIEQHTESFPENRRIDINKVKNFLENSKKKFTDVVNTVFIINI